ncbi:MAG: hypothetical protein K0R58_2408, partial [Ramlibacter sp.]|nr:hypothetical protein [Ramlibacter sp.]
MAVVHERQREPGPLDRDPAEGHRGLAGQFDLQDGALR